MIAGIIMRHGDNGNETFHLLWHELTLSLFLIDKLEITPLILQVMK